MFPAILLNHDLSPLMVWASLGLLYAGGLQFSWTWYGLRCLRMLGLETYEKAGV